MFGSNQGAKRAGDLTLAGRAWQNLLVASLAAGWLLALPFHLSDLHGQTPEPPPPAEAASNTEPAQAEAPSEEQEPLIPRPEPGKDLDLPAVFGQQAPASVADLKAMEEHVKDLIERVAPAAVAVQVGASSASGVVISKDGLVLTAAHVSEQPGRSARFTFPDGKTARGKTLGTNHELDAGLMQITDPGPWPHVEVSGENAAKLGDWVVALGHPGGFDPQRPIVARLGRVIRLSSRAVRTDCTIVGGDSGGPLIDMHGRVIGIHSRISDSTDENYHVPISAYLESWTRLAKGDNWGSRGPRARTWVGVVGVDHPEGWQVESVVEDGPASKAGLKVGDIVIKVDGEPVRDFAAFRENIFRARPGDEVTLEVKRANQEMSVKVTVAARPRRGRPFWER